MQRGWNRFVNAMRKSLHYADTNSVLSDAEMKLDRVFDGLILYGDSKEFKAVLDEFSEKHKGDDRPLVDSSTLLDLLQFELESISSAILDHHDEDMDYERPDLKKFSIAIGSLKDMLNLPTWVKNSLTLLDEFLELFNR